MGLLRVWCQFLVTAISHLCSRHLLPPRSHILSENHTQKLLSALCYCRSAPWIQGQKVELIRFKYRFYLYLVDCPYRFIPTLNQISPFSIHTTYFVMNQFNIIPHKSLNVQDFLQTFCMHFSSIPCVLHASPISSSTRSTQYLAMSINDEAHHNAVFCSPTMKLITMQCSAAPLLHSPYELQEFFATPHPQSFVCIIPSVLKNKCQKRLS
jgi:hypothetical protein